MKLAILGGSFNPFHLGHLELAQKVKKELDYDKIAIVPAFISPFKQKVKSVTIKDSVKEATSEERIKMIDLAITGIPYLYCEKYEVEKKGVSYTIDTINYLYENYSEIKKPIGLVIGDDHIDLFFKWKNVEEILQKANIIVAHRLLPENKTDKNSLLKAKIDFPFTELHNSILPISSTQIRKEILYKKEFKCLVPDPVYDYIIENNLYK